MVTDNTEEVLLRCLESLFGSEYHFAELNILDNASSHGSIEEARRRFPSIKVILNQKNLRYARADTVVVKDCAGNFS
jgi:GT2 family glycosyltransferase